MLLPCKKCGRKPIGKKIGKVLIAECLVCGKKIKRALKTPDEQVEIKELIKEWNTHQIIEETIPIKYY